MPERNIQQSADSGSKRLVGVIDAGTDYAAFTVYATPEFREVKSCRYELPDITPSNGWYEQDPLYIMDSVYRCCNEVCRALPPLGYNVSDIACIGITNERETTIAWDVRTGQPLYNAVSWKDIRNANIVNQLRKKYSERLDMFQLITGLPLSTYFSALKMLWLRANVPAVRRACVEKRCKFGTIDSWIVYNLTKGELHITDITNASRTLLMNIETHQWDDTMLSIFSVDIDSLPEIRSCSEIYGKIKSDRSILRGIPISGIVGNQQAALLGQMCLKPGMAKNTYRSGCFLLVNTGEKRIMSKHGLLTTVAYQLGPHESPAYALEGSIAVGGRVLRWLENRVRIMQDHMEAEKLAQQVDSTGDVYFVPAFTGLYAPYWRKDARGIIIGLTQYSTKYHVIRAAHEAICFQTRDILEAMREESGVEVAELYADGQLSANDLLMQLQADIAGLPVYRAQLRDSMPFGAALCAAQAEGINLYNMDLNQNYGNVMLLDKFQPQVGEEERKSRYGKWKRAVERSMGWVLPSQECDVNDEGYKLQASIPAACFVVGTFAMMVAAKVLK